MKIKSLFFSLLLLPLIAFAGGHFGCGGGDAGSGGVTVEPGPTNNPAPTTGDQPGSVVALCGNSVVEAGEQCDDGNTQEGDGCSSACQTQQRYTLDDAHLAFARSITPNTSDTEDVKKAYQKYFGTKDIVADPSVFQGDPMGFLRKFMQFIREADTSPNQQSFSEKYLAPIGEYNKELYPILINQNFLGVIWANAYLQVMNEKTDWLQKRIKGAADIYKVPLTLENNLTLFEVAFVYPVINSIENRFENSLGSKDDYKQFKQQLTANLKKLLQSVVFSVTPTNGQKIYLSYLWFESVLPVHCFMFAETTTCLQRGAYGAFPLEDVKPLISQATP